MIDVNAIYDLINLKQEGPNWDFKRQWYEPGHEGELLHDIICMANNIENRDAYIVIGVNEQDDYSVCDIINDPGRKKTQNIVDFLRGKSFAADTRPVVTVESVRVGDSTVDVIVIHNSNKTPFYLTEKYRQVHPYNIYSRIQDTNTPVDKSADLSVVEYLWKKRFGLILSPLERIRVLLQDKAGWDDCPGVEELKYYRNAPEYTIGYAFEDPEHRDGYEFYILSQTDNQPHWTVIQIKYHQTILKEVSALILDGGRHFSPSPLLDGVSFDSYSSWDISYSYFVKDSFEYLLHEFYYDKDNSEARWSDQRLMENILLFETEDEHQYFNWYLEQYWNSKHITYDVKDPYVENIPGYNMDVFKEQIKNAQIMQKMLVDFRNNYE